MFQRRESDDVYRALVQELFENTSPTWIMGALIFGVGIYAYVHVLNALILFFGMSGALASAVKVGLMVYYRPRMELPGTTLADVKLLERLQGATICGVGVSVGGLAAAIFAQSDLALQMLAVAMLFGYSAGVATRLSVRPVIACTTLCLTSFPALLSAASFGDVAHLFLAFMFATFLLAGVQGIWFTYRATYRQIAQRLEMASFARRDILTGLPNRRALRETFAALRRKPTGMTAVYCFDLDGFKLVNDQLGHFAGDTLLEILGARLKALVAASATAARIGGDEFVIVQPNIGDPASAAAFAGQIAEVVSAPYDLGSSGVTIGVSLGYSVADTATMTLDEMLRAADTASYRAKRSGGGVEAEIPLSLGRQRLSAAA